jgi:superfamily II DNA or RNA helicase
MTRTCTIQITDEVNCQLFGVEDYTIKKAAEAVTYTVKNSRFMEKVKAKQWSGKISLLYKNGKTKLHVLDKILPTIVKAGYEIVIDDQRFKGWNINVPEIQNNLFEGFHYKRFRGFMEQHQVDAINKITSNRGGIVQVATGGGKTLITAGLAQLYYRFGKVLVIVPRQDLAIETRDTIQAMGMEDCGAYFDEIKEPRWVTITTWQSLHAHLDLFHDVTCVIVDECHGADAKVLHDILSGAGRNVPIRIGMTGTMPKDDLSRYKIITALGPVIYTKRAKELQDEGFLARSHTFVLKYMDRHRPEYQEAKAEHIYYTDEMRWQCTYAPRIDHLAETIREISQHGNTLVLLRNRIYGEALSTRIPDSTYLNGDDKGKYRHEVYQTTNAKTNAVLICTYGIASTGIDVARIFNLVIIEPGKEAIPIVQSIGRGLRKADDKNAVMIYHIASDCKFSGKHLAEVEAIYKEHQYPFEIAEVYY